MVEEFKINKGILYSPLESPRPPPAHCPSPFSDLFTQIHLTFVCFVWLEFFSFFTSRIVDFCRLPFIFTLAHISSVLISYHVCFTWLRFYTQRSQSFSLFPNKVDHSGFFFRYSFSLLHIRHFFNCNIFSCRSKQMKQLKFWFDDSFSGRPSPYKQYPFKV